jgi:outer membrane protein W
MKKLYMLILSLVVTATAFSQQQAGDLSIQFSGNYFSQNVQFDGKKFKSYSGNIYLKLGKFFTQNIEMGLKPNIFFSPKEKVNPNNDQDIKYSLKTTFGLGLYGTYSYLTADGKFMPYGGAEVNYLPFGDEATLNLGPYVGVKYFVTEKVNIDANINYLINLASSYGNSVKGLDISPTTMLNLGVGVIISKSDE